jgi:hypothetical protein
MHNLDPLNTFIIGSGNESTHSLPMGKIGLGYSNGFSSFKLQTTPSPSDKLGIFNTSTNPTPQIQSVEGEDWVVLQPIPSPSKILLTKKRQIGLKSPSKFGVLEGENG